jgi:hypothetical protein
LIPNFEERFFEDVTSVFVDFVQPITFADFFVADVLTSMAKVGDFVFL